MGANATINEKQESLTSQFLFRFSPYWPLFILAQILFIAIAFIYIRYTTPKYQATATLIIKDQKKGYDDSKFLESLDVIGTKKIVENEVEVIQSRTIMENVVKALHLYAPVYEEGRVRDVSAYAYGPVSVQAKDADSITEAKEIYINYDSLHSSVVLIKQWKFPVNQWASTPYGVLRFVPNKNFVDKGKPFYFSLVNPKKVVGACLKNLRVTPSSRLSSFLTLSYKDDARQKAEDVLNGVINEYNRASIEEKNSLAKNTGSFVTERLDSVTKDLDSIHLKIQQFRASKDAIDISTQGRLFLENVSANDQKVNEVNMQLAALSQVQNYVVSNNHNEAIIPSTLGIDDPVLSQLLDKLYSLEIDYERLKKTTGENHPMLTSIADQINKIKPDILQSINSHRQTLQASKANLQVANGGYTSTLRSFPEKERQLLEISREEAIKNSIYSFLLNKKEETALSYASVVSDCRIIDKAQASLKPVSPRKKMVYLSSAVLALLSVIGIVFIKEGWNRTILYRDEIEAATDIPILGELTSDKSKSSPIVIGTGKRDLISEEFRKLRAVLPNFGIDKNRKKVLVTSSIPGEGKSFVAVNLAMSVALIGRKVVLVDADMNNPSLGRTLQIENEPGVSNFLSGQKDLEEIIKHTQKHENLFFVPAGDVPPNPAELLSNNKIAELLSFLEGIFDLIIIDTAPSMPVTDALILSPLCDATLYVIRHGYTPKIIVKRLDKTNKTKNLVNTAIIFNGVKARGFFKRSYGYGYGYGYDYVYNQSDQNMNSRT